MDNKSKLVKSLLNSIFALVPPAVQQGGMIQMLAEAVKEKKAAATELTLLIQELQELNRNLTAMRRGTSWRTWAEQTLYTSCDAHTHSHSVHVFHLQGFKNFQSVKIKTVFYVFGSKCSQCLQSKCNYFKWI